MICDLVSVNLNASSRYIKCCQCCMYKYTKQTLIIKSKGKVCYKNAWWVRNLWHHLTHFYIFYYMYMVEIYCESGYNINT